MKNKIVIHNENDLKNKIYTIRGVRVMLDKDLAEIYGYEVRALNQQVKRNINRFPEDFMFQLTREEVEAVMSQIVISRNKNMFEGQDGGTRKLPFVFTEQGIYMLATVLRGELAEQQSIFIMRAFRAMKLYIQENSSLLPSEEIKLLKQKRQNVSVIIFTENKRGNNGILTKSEITDFNNQFPTLNIKPNPDSHDRFIIIDYKTSRESVFHCGASSKDAGNKICTINKIENSSLVYQFIDLYLLQNDKII